MEKRWCGEGGRGIKGLWAGKGGGFPEKQDGVGLECRPTFKTLMRRWAGHGEGACLIRGDWGLREHFGSQFYPASSRCWERNEVKAIWWIIRTPILITILVGQSRLLQAVLRDFSFWGRGAPIPCSTPEPNSFWLSLFLLTDQFPHLHPYPWHPCFKAEDTADALPRLPTKVRAG